MNMFPAFLWSPVIAFFSLFALHDFHISVTEMDWDPRSGELTLATHIFIDDLEKGLTKYGAGDSLFLGTGFERPDADEWIYDYLQKHFVLEVDDRRIQFRWVGKELSDDLQALWVYLESDSPVKGMKALECRNDILLEVYDDQKNMLLFRVDHQQETSMLFNERKPQQRYELD